MAQGIKEQVGALPPIKAEAHLIQVGLQMLGADLVPASDYSTLEQRERGLYSVRVNVSPKSHVLLSAVINRLVLRAMNTGFNHGFGIGGVFVGDDYFHVLRDVFADVLRQCPALGVRSMEEPQITVTLANTDYNFLVFHTSFHAHAESVSPDIGFIHFYLTIQHRAVNLCHSSTDAMAEIPCGLIGTLVLSPQGTLELHGTHALLGFADQEYGYKPDRQRKVRVMENRSTRDRELIFAADALITGVFLQSRDAGVFTARTHDTLRPAQPFQKLAALFVGREHPIHV